MRLLLQIATTTANLKKSSTNRSDLQARGKGKTCARGPAGCHSGQDSGLGFLWVFRDTSVALKHNYLSFRLLKFEIPEMTGGLCCCPRECCYNHGITPGHGIKGSGSSQRPLGIILENKEWWSSSAFLCLHRARSVVPGACYARSCIWALSQREMHS